MTDSYNAAERQHVKLAAKSAKLAEEQRLNTMRSIMSLPSGRSYMLGILEACHVFSSSFNINALAMAFSEGERNVGLRLLSDVTEACPEQYIQMMEERNARDSTDTARRAGSNGNADRSEPETSRHDEGGYDSTV